MTAPDASSFTMRPAILEDLDALLAIDAQCFPAGIAYPKEEIASLLSARTVFTLVGEHSRMIVGFASIRLLPQRRVPQPSRRGELITIDVLPEFRRAHVGWQLHLALENWLLSSGGGSIELHVAVDNIAAIRFYERLGYRIIGNIPQYYLEIIDAWRMEKLLS